MRKADAPLHRAGSRRAWLTRPGRTGAERRHCHCRSCGKERFPLDRAPGLEDSAFTPGMAGVMAGTVPVTGFGAALRSGREKAVERSALEPRMHLSVDGTGIPMRKEGAGGAAGRRDGGSPETRGGRPAAVCAAGGRGRETGAAPKDRGSGTVGCLTGGAAAPSGAGEPAVISDGAEWTGNACGKPSGGPGSYAAGTERRRRAAAASGTASGGCAATGAAARACRPEAASWKAAAAGPGSG